MVDDADEGQRDRGGVGSLREPSEPPLCVQVVRDRPLHRVEAGRPGLERLADALGGRGPGEREAGAPEMLSQADPDRVRHVLTAAGFTEVTVTAATAYGVWGRDAEDAAGFLLGSGPARHLLQQATPEAQDRARAALTQALRRHEDGGAVRLRGAAWLVTAVRAPAPGR
ncbi:hypothetical protein [Streptomyces sp. NPDC093707]|uniref:hypothetical protein n=1 Tax=Streptomyces sp. NPDC093707 TaxID=3154984 RepID=UPI00344E26DD